jgi:hypothetical protein
MGKIDKHVVAIAKERDEYRQLLDECLYAFNYIPNKRIDDGDGGTTYKLAAKIEKQLKKWED